MENMPDENCKNCPNNNKCSETYERLGKYEGGNVAFEVSIAFLLPILVLIVTITIFNYLIGDQFKNQTVGSLLGLLTGLFMAILSVFIAKMVHKKK